MTTLTREDFVHRLMYISQTMAAHSDGKVRVALNEQDTTRDFDPEAQHHLKVNEQRVGRDFELLGFMTDIYGSFGAAMADFAVCVMDVKRQVPAAYAVVLPDVLKLGEFLGDPALVTRWQKIWEEK